MDFWRHISGKSRLEEIRIRWWWTYKLHNLNGMNTTEKVEKKRKKGSEENLWMVKDQLQQEIGRRRRLF